MIYTRADDRMTYVGRYYDRSRMYRAQNDAKGAELDLLRSMIDEIAEQFFVETATWGIDRWEQYCGLSSNGGDSIEVRRQRVISWLQIISPITPKVMQRICEGSVHTKVEIEENIASYTFGVYFDFPSSSKINILDLMKVIEEAKPAHLAVFFRLSLFAADCDMKYAAALSEINQVSILPQFLKRLDTDIKLLTAGIVVSEADTVIEPVGLKCISGEIEMVGICGTSSVIYTAIEPHKFKAIQWGYVATAAAFAFSIVSVTINPRYDTGSTSEGVSQSAATTSSVQSIISNSKED